MSVISLSYLDLVLAGGLVLLLGALTLLLELGLTRQLFIAALRTAVQLTLIGLVLKVLFENANLLWVGAMSTVMVLAAGREVMARQKRRFAGIWGFGLGAGAMFISSFTLTVLALTVLIGTEPWYEPRYAIPLLGMLLGNTMTGVALGLDRLTSAAWTQRPVIEARLALGQTAKEAIAPVRSDSVRVGLVAIINAMAAAGIVSLPGMMTGQILAGTPPVEAVKYQILIMFLISGGTGFGTVLAVWVGAKRLFDQRERLRLDRLVPPDG